MKAVKLAYSHEHMLDLLGLPADCVIVGVNQRFSSAAIELVVSHPKLDHAPEGAQFVQMSVQALRAKVSA